MTAVDALERAISAQVRPAIGMYANPSREEHAAFERSVDEICRESHRLQLRAEEMLVAVKQAWTQLAPLRARHLGERDGDVLRVLVSSCIEVFFDAREAEGGRAQ